MRRTEVATAASDGLPRVVRDEGGVAIRVATQDDFDRDEEAKRSGRGAAPQIGYFLDYAGQPVFLDVPRPDDLARWPEQLRGGRPRQSNVGKLKRRLLK